jgi:hypothetical protein
MQESVGEVGKVSREGGLHAAKRSRVRSKQYYEPCVGRKIQAWTF